MIANLKQAKARLSELVEVASSGEEVIITVRGKARARLCQIPQGLDKSALEAWGHRLEEARAQYRVKRNVKDTDSQEFWDNLRGER